MTNNDKFQMKETERNRRLFLLLDKLIGQRDIKSLELIQSLVDNDTEAMKKTYSLLSPAIEELKHQTHE